MLFFSPPKPLVVFALLKPSLFLSLINVDGFRERRTDIFGADTFIKAVVAREISTASSKGSFSSSRLPGEENREHCLFDVVAPISTLCYFPQRRESTV